MAKDSRLVVVLAALFAGGLLALMAGMAVSNRMAESRVDQAREGLARAGAAVSARFVDSALKLVPGPDNALPAALTTPIAYLPKLEEDPFADSRMPLRFVIDGGTMYGAGYIISSMGPDGDWDLGRLPGREYVADGRTIAPELLTARQREMPGIYEIVVLDRDVTHGIVGRARPEAADALIEYLAGHDIAIYDPTNGAISDGDILFVGWGSPPGLMLPRGVE